MIHIGEENTYWKKNLFDMVPIEKKKIQIILNYAYKTINRSAIRVGIHPATFSCRKQFLYIMLCWKSYESGINLDQLLRLLWSVRLYTINIWCFHNKRFPNLVIIKIPESNPQNKCWPNWRYIWKLMGQVLD